MKYIINIKGKEFIRKQKLKLFKLFIIDILLIGVLFAIGIFKIGFNLKFVLSTVIFVLPIIALFIYKDLIEPIFILRKIVITISSTNDMGDSFYFETNDKNIAINNEFIKLDNNSKRTQELFEGRNVLTYKTKNGNEFILVPEFFDEDIVTIIKGVISLNEII